MCAGGTAGRAWDRRAERPRPRMQIRPSAHRPGRGNGPTEAETHRWLAPRCSAFSPLPCRARTGVPSVSTSARHAGAAGRAWDRRAAPAAARASDHLRSARGCGSPEAETHPIARVRRRRLGPRLTAGERRWTGALVPADWRVSFFPLPCRARGGRAPVSSRVALHMCASRRTAAGRV
jgi:hypothetical protein